jgi:hypothetical protein
MSGRGRPSRGQRGASSVTIHAVLAGLALVAAYLSWTRDRTTVKEDQPVVLDYGKRDVERLNYQDESRTVAVERKTGADGEPYAWVTVTTRTKTLVTNPMAPPPAPGAPAPAGVAPAPGSPHGAPPAVSPSPHGAPPAASPHGVPPTAPSALRPVPTAPPPAGANKNKGGDKAAGDKDQPAAGAALASAPPAPAAGTAPPAAGAAPAAAPAPAPIHDIKETVTVKSFRGSDAAMDLFASFGPLRAIRALGQVDDKKAKELGFPDSKKKLTVTAKGQTTEFVLGSTSYGGGDSYARDGQGRAFLLPQRIIADFEFAESRLMERRLHRFERADFDRVEITVGGKKRMLLQQKRQDPTNYYFSDAATPDKRDDTMKNWMDKVLRIAISDYVAQGEEPQASPPPGAAGQPALGDIMTLRFYEGRKEIGNAVFSRQLNPKTNQPEFYGRTETTISLVRLLGVTAESAIQDAEKWQ